ncbi:hypothetical protein Tco_1548349 [Tanacetum coccineum]
MEVSRLSGMDNDLFTYKVEVANIPCNSVMDDDLEDETNTRVEMLSLYMRCLMDGSADLDGSTGRFEGAWIRGREEDSILTHRIAKAIPVVNVVVQDGSNFDRVFDMEGRCSMKESLDVVNHRHNNLTVRKDTLHQFHGRENDSGLYDHNKGYLVNYMCYFHLYVAVRQLAEMVILLAAGETDFVEL